MAGFENDIMYAKNADFTQADNQAAVESNGLVTNGKIWIGSTALNVGGTHINVGSLTSPDSSITFGFSSPNITAQVTGGSTSVVTLTGNTGVATPVAGNINVITSNTTVKFTGAGSTLTQNFALTNLLIGVPGSAITTAATNVSLGSNAAAAITSALANVLIGFNAGKAITSSESNTAVGAGALNLFTTGAANAGNNCAFGANTCNNLVSGTNNTAIGQDSLAVITTGTDNIALGNRAGTGHTIADSSNIDIGNLGTAANSNTIRIGTQGAGTGQQNRNFQAGIAGVTTSNSQAVTIDTTTGQLGAVSMASTLVTTLTSGSGNWTANARTQYVKLIMYGGGGGGGSGRKGTTAASAGGGSGGPGQVCYFEGPVAFFSGSIAYSIGASAAGGTPQATDATDGNPGTPGNNTTFGSLAALGGNAGSGGNAASGPSGALRALLGSFSKTIPTLSSAGNGTTTTGNAGFPIGTNSVAGSQGQALPSTGGGGGGGDVAVARAGGIGGNAQSADGTILIAGAAGGIASGTINGSDGSTSIQTGSLSAGLGGGGGGGCFINVAGIGGNGSEPGGPGGGGGGGIATVANSGAGGIGAAGRIIIIESF